MTVLIVDDSKMNITVAKDTLNEYHVVDSVVTCLSGEEALDIVDKQAIDLILLDIVMPGLTGVDVLKALLQKRKLEVLKVMMLTTVDDASVLKECFELGATDYIQKPFNKIEFSARVKSVLNDIASERKLKKALELLEKQNNELIRVNKMLKDAQDYMIEKEKMTAIGQLVGGLVKELNEPLTNMDYTLHKALKVLDTLTHDVSPDVFYNRHQNTSDSLQVAMDDIGHLSKIVRALGRSTVDQKKEAYAPTRVSDMVEDVLLLLKNELKQVSHVHTEFGDPAMIICPKASVRGAIMNVLLNAIHAVKNKADSEIRLKTIETDEHILLVVKDNGYGIDEAIQSRVFEPFFTTKPKTESMGLGLSKAYDIIVKELEGQISLESTVGEGTTLTLVFNRKQR